MLVRKCTKGHKIYIFKPRTKENVSYKFSDDEKMLLNHINDMQSKINTNQFMRDQLEVGKEAFINKLRESLEAEPVEEEAEAEA